jgi:Co/Zn/Cd efflux system component
MADHADHHHAAPAKPNATTTMGIALFFGMVTIIVALVGAIRNSHDILMVGLITGVITLVVALIASGLARKAGHTRRGFIVSVLLGLSGVAMYALVTNV